jgi:hypothetical protein
MEDKEIKNTYLFCYEYAKCWARKENCEFAGIQGNICIYCDVAEIWIARASDLKELAIHKTFRFPSKQQT